MPMNSLLYLKTGLLCCGWDFHFSFFHSLSAPAFLIFGLNFEFSVDYPFYSLFFPLYMLITGCVFEFGSYKSDILRKLLVTYVPKCCLQEFHATIYAWVPWVSLLQTLPLLSIICPVYPQMNICVITRFSLKK